MRPEPRSALVTGGAGFIGSHLVDALVAGGDTVTVLDDLSTGRTANLQGALAAGATLIEADVCDAAVVTATTMSARPAVVFHLAAQIDVRRAMTDPAMDARVNIEGTINVLEAARHGGAARVVQVSTGGAIYGEADVLPTPESAADQPLSPYGESKLAAEGYAGLYARLYGLSTVCPRLANVYGARQDPLGEGGVIAIHCSRALSGGRPVIFGDGRQTRDFLHVDDVVDALLRVAGSDTTGSINLGTGVQTSVLELVEALRPHAVASWEPQFDSARAGEVRRSALDASRARSELAWIPQTGLGEGLARTLAAQTTVGVS